MSSIRARWTTGQIAAFDVIVDAIDHAARAFYRHHSFLPLPDSPPVPPPQRHRRTVQVIADGADADFIGAEPATKQVESAALVLMLGCLSRSCKADF
jgi:hypothetical protein